LTNYKGKLKNLPFEKIKGCGGIRGSGEVNNLWIIVDNFKK